MKGQVTAKRHASERKKPRRMGVLVVLSGREWQRKIQRMYVCVTAWYCILSRNKDWLLCVQMGDRLSMSGTGIEDISSQRCVHIGPKQRSITINRDGGFYI
jgi:hypothetical protein